MTAENNKIESILWCRLEEIKNLSEQGRNGNGSDLEEEEMARQRFLNIVRNSQEEIELMPAYLRSKLEKEAYGRGLSTYPSIEE